MVLKETIYQMEQLLGDLSRDLQKAAEGNRAAAQRVRTGSIKLTKISKVYRQESVAAERGASSGKSKKR